jgi:hypothetical protein
MAASYTYDQNDRTDRELLESIYEKVSALRDDTRELQRHASDALASTKSLAHAMQVREVSNEE